MMWEDVGLGVMENYFGREFIIYFCAAPVADIIILTHVSRRISFSKSRFHVNVIGENIFELLNGFFGTILRLLNDLFDIPIFFDASQLDDVDIYDAPNRYLCR